MSHNAIPPELIPVQAGTSNRRQAFSVRPYRQGDAAGALQLFQECFSLRRDPLEWAWKFERPLTHQEPPFQVAEAGGRLVGMYPARTVRLQLGDAKRVMALLQDICVHPDYRGGSLVRAMHRANGIRWRAAGIPLGIGFPNLGHMKFGARFMGYVEMFYLSVWSRRLARGLHLQAWLGSDWARRAAYGAGAALQEIVDRRWFPPPQTDVRVADLSQFNASVDQLWDRVRSTVRFAVVRDADYLTWRYLDRPGRPFQILGASRNGRLEGYCVFRDDCVHPNGCRMGVVMDLVAVDPEAARHLVETALARMRQSHCGHVLALCHPAMVVSTALAASGFVPDPRLGKVIVCLGYHAPDIDIEALRQPADWLLGYGDTDDMG